MQVYEPEQRNSLRVSARRPLEASTSLIAEASDADEQDIELQAPGRRRHESTFDELPPPLGVKLTGYRLLFMSVVFIFGTVKAILSYMGESAVPTALDWFSGTFLGVILYFIGLYEENCSKKWKWFFQVDLTRGICYAQQHLAALAAATPPRRRASDNQVSTTAQTSVITAARPILPTVATAPMPLNHPWNLPAPAPPTTPRTTRRQMLSTELSESLRRNLLWERQVSKTNLLGNAGRRNGLGGGGSRLATTVVNGNGNAQAGPLQQPQNQRGQGSGDGAQDSIAERRQRALARNRKWADDFHYTGW